ncbi:MAG: leucine-rich repeat domain-containing protein [Cyanobacteria bacterium P01_F01_bin.13]
MGAINTFNAVHQLSVVPTTGGVQTLSVGDTATTLRALSGANPPRGLTGWIATVSSISPGSGSVTINGQQVFSSGRVISGFAPGNEAGASGDMVAGLIANPTLQASAGATASIDFTYYAELGTEHFPSAINLLSATVEDATPNQVVFTYSATLSGTPPFTADFALSGKTVTDAQLVGATIVVTVDTPYQNGDVITGTYTPGVNRITGNAVEVAGFTGQSITNNIAAPSGFSLSSTSVSVAGPAIVEVLYTEELDSAFTPETSAFTVSGRTVKHIQVDGDDSRAWVVLDTPLVNGDTRTISYTQPATNQLRSSTGTLADSFTNLAITNPVPAGIPLLALSSRTNTAGVPAGSNLITLDLGQSNAGLINGSSIAEQRGIWQVANTPTIIGRNEFINQGSTAFNSNRGAWKVEGAVPILGNDFGNAGALADRAIKEMQAYTNTIPTTHYWRALNWVQGESDADNFPDGLTHEPLFLTFADALDQATGRNWLWTLGQTNDAIVPATYDQVGDVRDGYASIGAEFPSKYGIYDQSGIALGSDLLHYLPAGLLENENRARAVVDAANMIGLYVFEYPSVEVIIENGIDSFQPTSNTKAITVRYTTNSSNPVLAEAIGLTAEFVGIGEVVMTPRTPLPANGNTIEIVYDITLSGVTTWGDIAANDRNISVRYTAQGMGDTAGNRHPVDQTCLIYQADWVLRTPFAITVDAGQGVTFKGRVRDSVGVWSFSDGTPTVVSEADATTDVALTATTGNVTVTCFLEEGRTQLYLINCGITDFDISGFNNLTRLRLGNNPITALPAAVWTHTSLSDLNCTNCNIGSISSDIQNLTTLDTLNLGNNSGISLPSELTTLTDVDTLFLNNCGLTTLPSGFDGMTALRSLQLGGNSLSITVVDALLNELATGAFTSGTLTADITSQNGINDVNLVSSPAALTAAQGAGWNVT